MTLRLAACIVAMSISTAMAVGCEAETEPSPAQQSPQGARVGEFEGAEQVAAWGEPAVAGSAEALAAEFARHADSPVFDGALRGDDPAAQATAAWSLARIGGEPALDRLIHLLDGDRAPRALAAYALLEAPRDAGGDPLPVTGRWRELEDALWTRYAVTENDEHALALLLSLARVGGVASVRRLATDLAHLPSAGDASALQRYVAGLDAVAILCARGLPLELRARDAIAQGLDHGEARVREASAHALARCVTSSAELIALTEERAVLLDRLERQLSSSSDQRLAWKAFATIGETPKAIPAGILGSPPPPWITEVEAVRALATTPDGRAALLARLPTLELESIVDGPRLHVVLEALRALRSSAADDPAVTVMVDALAGQLAAAHRGAGTPRRESARVHLRLELETLAAIAGGRMDRLPDCQEDARATYLPPGYCANAWVEGIMHMTRPGTTRMEAASNLPLEADAEVDEAGRRGRLDRLLQLAQDGDAATATPALAALAEVADPRAKEVLRSALTRDDAGVRAAAATAVATRSLDAEKRDLDAVPALTAIVLGTSDAEAVEARIAAVAALGGLARAAHAAVVEGGGPAAAATDGPWLLEVVVPLARDPHVAIREQARRVLLDRPELLASFDAQLRGGELASPFAAGVDASEFLARRHGAGLRIHTRDGEIDISFAGAPAPINQANLEHLAEAGFFDGLRVHRVVPGFVVQGGDPRGDGYGGPGYLLPCEWSNLRYERGTVGIALAGKDTGGSQIFITQSRQAHLDARYTIVGHVVRGMDVVDRLLPGDTITSVTVLADADASARP